MRAPLILVPALALFLANPVAAGNGTETQMPPPRTTPLSKVTIEFLVENETGFNLHRLRPGSKLVEVVEEKVAEEGGEEGGTASERASEKHRGSRRKQLFETRVRTNSEAFPPPPKLNFRVNRGLESSRKEQRLVGGTVQTGSSQLFTGFQETESSKLLFEVEGVTNYLLHEDETISDEKPYVFQISPKRSDFLEPGGRVDFCGDFRFLLKNYDPNRPAYNPSGDNFFAKVRTTLDNDDIKTFSKNLWALLEKEEKQTGRELTAPRAEALADMIEQRYGTLLLTQKQLLDIHETKTVHFNFDDGTNIIQRKVVVRRAPLPSSGWPAPWVHPHPFEQDIRSARAAWEASLLDKKFIERQEKIARTHHFMGLYLNHNIRHFSTPKVPKLGQRYWEELTPLAYKDNSKTDLGNGLAKQIGLYHISSPQKRRGMATRAPQLLSYFTKEQSAEAEPGLQRFLKGLNVWTSDVANKRKHTSEYERHTKQESEKSKRDSKKYIPDLHSIKANIKDLRQHEGFLQQLAILNAPESSIEVQEELFNQANCISLSPDQAKTPRGISYELAAEKIGGIQLASEQEILHNRTLYHSYMLDDIEMMLREVTNSLEPGHPAAIVIKNGKRTLTVLRLRNGKLMVFDPDSMYFDTHLYASDNHKHIAGHIHQFFVHGAQRRPHHCTTQVLVNQLDYTVPLDLSGLKKLFLERFLWHVQESPQSYGVHDFYHHGEDIAYDDSTATIYLLDYLQEHTTFAERFIEESPKEGRFNLVSLVIQNQALQDNNEHWQAAMTRLINLLIAKHKLVNLLVPVGSIARNELEQTKHHLLDTTWLEHLLEFQREDTPSTVVKRPLPPIPAHYHNENHALLNGKTSSSNYFNLKKNISMAQSRWLGLPQRAVSNDASLCLSVMAGLSNTAVSLENHRELAMPISETIPMEPNGFRTFLYKLGVLATDYHNSSASTVLGYLAPHEEFIRQLMMLHQPEGSMDYKEKKEQEAEMGVESTEITCETHIARDLIARDMDIDLGWMSDQLFKRTLYHYPKDMEEVLSTVAEAVIPQQRNCSLLVWNNLHMLAVILLKDGKYLVFNPNDMNYEASMLVSSDHAMVANAIQTGMDRASTGYFDFADSHYSTSIMVNMEGGIGETSWADFTILKKELLMKMLPSAQGSDQQDDQEHSLSKKENLEQLADMGIHGIGQVQAAISDYKKTPNSIPDIVHVKAFSDISQLMRQKRSMLDEPDISVADFMFEHFRENPELADFAFAPESDLLQYMFKFLMTNSDALYLDTDLSARLLYNLVTQLNSRREQAVKVLGKIMWNPHNSEHSNPPAEREWLTSSLLKYIPTQHPRFEIIKKVLIELKDYLDRNAVKDFSPQNSA